MPSQILLDGIDDRETMRVARPANVNCMRLLMTSLLLSVISAAAGAGELAVIEQHQASIHWVVLATGAALCCMLIKHCCGCLSSLADARTCEELPSQSCPQVFYITPTGRRLHQDKNCNSIRHSRGIQPYELCRVCCAELVEETEV